MSSIYLRSHRQAATRSLSCQQQRKQLPRGRGGTKRIFRLSPCLVTPPTTSKCKWMKVKTVAGCANDPQTPQVESRNDFQSLILFCTVLSFTVKRAVSRADTHAQVRVLCMLHPHATRRRQLQSWSTHPLFEDESSLICNGIAFASWNHILLWQEATRKTWSTGMSRRTRIRTSNIRWCYVVSFFAGCRVL